MNKLRQSILVLGDLILIIISLYLASYIRLERFIEIFHTRYLGATIITIGLYLTLFYIFELYNQNQHRHSVDVLLRVSVAVVFADILSALIFYGLPDWKYGRGIWFFQMVFVLGFVFLWRMFFIHLLAYTLGKKRILILGANDAGRFFYEWVKKFQTATYEVVGFLDDDLNTVEKKIGEAKILGPISKLIEIGEQEKVTTAILATQTRDPGIMENILKAKLKGWTITGMVEEYEENTGRVPVRYIHDEWILFAEGFYLLKRPLMQKMKRIIDLVSSVFLLVILSPIFFLTAVAIRLDSPGTVFYRQVRVGKDGRRFTLWKFRSMYQGAENNGAVWAQEKDPRVTRVGHWIRLLRIDEIPQMINVMKGDMSLIGPRPERPEFVCALEKEIPYYSLRHLVKPGVTGWAQVNYRYSASNEDALNKLEFDLYYIKNMSLLMDFKIMLKTIGVVSLGNGAR